MATVKIIPVSEFRRINSLNIPNDTLLAIIADMCRVNALSIVKRAGSGHLGSSFSSMDIFTLLYYDVLNIKTRGVESPERDIFFSSKGHDAPGLYAVLYSLGIIAEDKFVNLRRYEGLEGHPDVSTPGIEVNSGSLGMGISKARGFAWAKRFKKQNGHVFVLTGDGELQEGQNYEALQNIFNEKLAHLTVIVDHNKVQSDKYVHDIADLGDLERKVTAFGWKVDRCNGNDLEGLRGAFSRAKENSGPTLLICDTLKGKGVSFMEHPHAMTERTGGLYPWHAGAPSDHDYHLAFDEILNRCNKELGSIGVSQLDLKVIKTPVAHSKVYTLGGEQISLATPVEKVSKSGGEFVADVYGETLMDLADEYPEMVVLDADLAVDCRVRPFEEKYPKRFVECGIAEQDMVSVAGGLASQGLLPIVNSFSSFLASRANEQIYNNASENSKVIYGCHYAGLIPAGPGKSHQSIRDISLLGALPNMVILQPCNSIEAKMVVNYAVKEAVDNVAIRLIIGPSPRAIQLPDNYKLEEGRGCFVNRVSKSKVLVFSYGPVMLHEALIAAEILEVKGFPISVINMPWLNRLDGEWFEQITRNCEHVVVVEDHSEVGGLGDALRRYVLATEQFDHLKSVQSFGVVGYPMFGTPPEALRHHRLDGNSLAERVLKLS